MLGFTRSRLAPIGATATKAWELLYPPRCVGCARFGEPLCATCLASCLPGMGEGRCGHCSASWEWPDFCPRCSRWDAIDRGLAAFEHGGPARAAVLALKYGRQRVIARAMAGPMQPLWDVAEVDLAVAIPLHSSRKRRRGFNQADVLLNALGWPHAPGRLRRTRKTDSQVGMTMSRRRRNVAGAFVYEGPELGGARIALIDDVITTGATTNECARVLHDFGASRVVAVAFTRASYSRDPHRGIRD
jgi:ComF family protein